MESIKLGTCVKGEDIVTVLPDVIKSGFESIELYYDSGLQGTNLVELSKKVNGQIEGSEITVSSIGLYVNPLQYENQRKELEYCIDNARRFGAQSVSTFAGAMEGTCVEESLPKFKEVFGELVKRAEYNGVKLGIENAHMCGFWYRTTCNIGFTPRAWEMMFHEVESDSLGLVWEPSHQIEQFIDVYSQLKTWLPKIIHIHGKDGKIDWNHVKKYGAWFGEKYCSHRFPGLGDSNWNEIISILSAGEYKGDITIEGFHDPEFNGEREFEGQKNALLYLKNCRNEISK
jgi:sugar phosphate isomerase/epimerase